ncbi:hypothetical protein FQN60_013765, partial [Etheostoma spectabile]
MEPEINNETPTVASYIDGNVRFSHVSAVATGWMFDFMFVSLCRRFKEGKFDEFNEALLTFQAISKSPSLNRDLHNEKTMICAFLVRVMHGKQLNVLFEEDDHVMPLMSATKIWSNLEHTVADESLFTTITILLLVQSVAVCLEKGKRSSASSVLKWFENNKEFPQKVRVKLLTIVTRRETYHPFLMSFSFSRLLDTIQTYLDAYLEKNPSDYLLKAAEMMVQSQNIEGLDDVVTQDSSLSEEATKSTEDRKTKRKLLSTKVMDAWKPDTCKKAFVSLRRISQNELSQMTSLKSTDTLKITKTRKPPQDGVKHHGQGKWSRILMDYDFEGRTGTMLKDRWRVLMRLHK